jgi:Na+-transporting methylmalonyl-CoA/oxaloacetate decarboxylase gamma subunit
MSDASLLILASIEGSFWEDVNFQLVGFVIVLLTLTGLWLALEVIGQYFKSAGKRQAAAVASAPVHVPEEEGTDPELFAVIAAAVDTAINMPHQIVSITSEARPGSGSHSAWSSEGRKDIYRSHTIR